MTSREIRTIGPYVAGEIPRDQVVAFFASDPEPMTGWQLGLTCTRDDVELTGWGSVSWESETLAEARIKFPEMELEADHDYQQFKVQVWGGNAGTYRLATLELWFLVYKAVGTVPAV